MMIVTYAYLHSGKFCLLTNITLVPLPMQLNLDPLIKLSGSNPVDG